MKKIAYNLILTSVLGFFLLLSTFNINAQNNKETNSEAVIYLRYSKNISLNIATNERVKSAKDIYFLKNLVDKYQITVAEFPFNTNKNNKLNRTFRIKYNNVNKTNSLISELKQIKELDIVEKAPNYQTVTVNDPYYNQSVTGTYNSTDLGGTNSSWYLNIIQAAEAWELIDGSENITIAVLDNAFKTDHEDLAGIFTSTIDLTDLNDLTNTTVEPADNTYEWSHGTLMSGIIAANSNNNIGIAGTGRNVNLMAIKLAENTNPNYQNIINLPEAIVYAVDNGAKIINISLATNQWSETLLQAVNYAMNNNVVIVAAAGNNNNTNSYYPAAMPGVISVGSTDADDLKSSFSNHGEWINIYAPGGTANLGYSGIGGYSILSSSANTPNTIGSILSNETGGAASYIINETAISGNYDLVYGTSVSTAITSAVCGMMLSQNPNLTPEQIKEIIKITADTTIENILRINAFKAVQMVKNIPTDTMLIAFQANQTNINIQDEVTFSILQPATIENNDIIEWAFEGGVPATSNELNPIVKYFDRGRFNVSLKITKKDFDNPIIDTLWKIIVDSIWSRDSIWGTNIETGSRELIRIDTVVYSRDTTWLRRIDTTYNILQEAEAKMTELVLVGKQLENVADIPKSALREQVSNLPSGYKPIKIDPVSNDIVWVLAENAGNYKILRSENYGTEWQNKDITITNLLTVHDITATSFDNIWMLVELTDNEKIIYHSNDGAETWTIAKTLNAENGFTGNLQKIKAIDENFAYAIGIDENSNYAFFKTEDAWENINVTKTLEEDEIITSNLVFRNNVFICGTNKGKLYFESISELADASIPSSPVAIASDTTTILSISFTDAKSSNEFITQGLALVKENDNTRKVYTSNGMTTWEEMNIDNFENKILEEIILHPSDISLMTATSVAASEIIALAKDEESAKAILYYTRNGGTDWQIVDSVTNYNTVALYDYHRGWFGAEATEYSSGIFKWFDVPVINSNSIILYERDTLGSIESDFTKTPKQHYRVEITDVDNHPTSLDPITSIAIFSFNYDDTEKKDCGELSGVVTIAVTNPNGNSYYSMITANNGVRYSTKRDTIIIKTTRRAPVFIYENCDTIFSLLIDTTITTEQVFELAIKIIDPDYDQWNAPRGVTGENISFYHDNTLPVESTHINGFEQKFSWLTFVDNNDHTPLYKTAKLYGVTDKAGVYNIKVRCTDGMFNKIPGETSEYLNIKITVLQRQAGIEENIQDKIRLYPNPTSDYISVSNAEGLRYEVIDITGKIIEANVFTNSILDVSSYKNGSYFIKIYDKEGVSTQKFIKY